jgi:two-component system chemotaxis response regulator CheY
MKTVLIVDDSLLMRRIIGKILTENGFNVIGEAENGKIGVEKYSELKPDIITMDITLEEMHGIDALKAIKKINPSTVVVMISSMVNQSAINAEILQAGADAWINKPFKEEKFLEVFDKFKNR